MASEEARVVREENSTEVLTAFNRIPYALISAEVGSSTAQDTLQELTEICRYYAAYKKGAEFSVEGSNGDYIAANLRYKMAGSLINKEARFLFAEPPDIKIDAKGDLGRVTKDARDNLTVLNDLVQTVLSKNMFEDSLIKAAKDCFIGKRVAGLVNFNEEDGIVVTFLPSTQFIYKTKVGNPRVITKFVAFIVVQDSIELKSKRIFKKKYELDDGDGKVYLEEAMYNGSGNLEETITERQEILLDFIPAVIITNDGLTGDLYGESEIEGLRDYETWYSKLSNSDIDANRKSMNPTKYTVDMESNSTKNLSTAAGSVWHMGTDQNLDSAHPMVGILEPNMSYSSSLKTTLDRIKTAGYESLDMPNITLESLQGAITSGKALKAIYWPLITRCKEKMKVWGPCLRRLTEIIIEGAMVYPNTAIEYTSDPIAPVAYEIEVVQNLPLPEDEQEERQSDMSEVEGNVMSRKAYMKKWRNLTDDEVREELDQMALERQILEDSTFSGELDESEEGIERLEDVPEGGDSYDIGSEEPGGEGEGPDDDTDSIANGLPGGE